MLSEQLGFDIHQVTEDKELLSSNPGPSNMEDGLNPVYYSDCSTPLTKLESNGLDLRHKVSVEDNFVSQVFPQQTNKQLRNARLGSNEDSHTINNLDKKQDANRSNSTTFVSNDMGPSYLSQHHHQNAINTEQPVWNTKSRFNPRNSHDKQVKCRNSIKKRSGVQAKLPLAKSSRRSQGISNTKIKMNIPSNVNNVDSMEVQHPPKEPLIQVASTNVQQRPFYDRPPERTSAESHGHVSSNDTLNRSLINEH